MSKITNWSKQTNRTTSSVRVLQAEIRRWEHDITEDTISIDFVSAAALDRSETPIYHVILNGDVVTARDTLAEAEDEVIRTMRANTDGLDFS